MIFTSHFRCVFSLNTNWDFFGSISIEGFVSQTLSKFNFEEYQMTTSVLQGTEEALHSNPVTSVCPFLGELGRTMHHTCPQGIGEVHGGEQDKA